MNVFRKRRVNQTPSPPIKRSRPSLAVDFVECENVSVDELMQEIQSLQEELNSDIWKKHETQKAELEALASSQMKILSDLTNENQKLLAKLNASPRKHRPLEEENAQLSNDVRALNDENTEIVKKIALEHSDINQIIEFRKTRLAQAREFCKIRHEIVEKQQKLNQLSRDLFKRRQQLPGINALKIKLDQLITARRNERSKLEDLLRTKKLYEERHAKLISLRSEKQRLIDLEEQIKIVKSLISDLRDGKLPDVSVQRRIRNDFMADAQETQESQLPTEIPDPDEAAFESDKDVQARIEQFEEQIQEIRARVTKSKTEGSAYLQRIANKSQELASGITKLLRFWNSL